MWVNKLGGISVHTISSGSLTLDTSAGKVEVNGFTGKLKAGSKLGEVELNNIKGDIEVEASSNHGSISGIDGGRGQDGDNKGELTLGGGAGSARLETRNGSINVDVRD